MPVCEHRESEPGPSEPKGRALLVGGQGGNEEKKVSKPHCSSKSNKLLARSNVVFEAENPADEYS